MQQKSTQNYGELMPTGGGDPIPLIKDRLLVGRRSSCDIVLRFPNISSNHCQLFVEQGYWFAKDLNSRNGTKVNGKRIATRKRIDPGDQVAFAKHQFTLEYSPGDLGAVGPPPPDEEVASAILGKSLLDRAGLNKRSRSDDDDLD